MDLSPPIQCYWWPPPHTPVPRCETDCQLIGITSRGQSRRLKTEPGWNGDEVSEDGLMQGGIGAGFGTAVGELEPVSARVDEVGKGGWVEEESRGLAPPAMVGG